jgi:hypothetical protein
MLKAATVSIRKTVRTRLDFKILNGIFGLDIRGKFT